MTLAMTLRKATGLAIATVATAALLSAQAPVKYQATWESLKQYQAPEWYKDAKFGIFLHWGVYAVPAFDNEWYPHSMYVKYEIVNGKPANEESEVFKYHREKYGPQSKFGYKDFIPMFKAEKWNPEAWAELFKKAGARYVVQVAEHHDGFAMWASKETPYNAKDMGPHRDLVGDLSKAVRSAGMKYGVSDHDAYNWRYYTYADDYDTNDPKYAALYSPKHPRSEPASKAFLDNYFARERELIDGYHPDVLWIEGWDAPEFVPYRQQIGAYYYNAAENWGGVGVLNYKGKNFPEGTAVLDLERGKLDYIRNMVWQTDTSISLKSWGYIANDDFRTPHALVNDLVDIVSKNGVLLLNVGPRADGTIPDEAQKILLEIGKWLRVNGDAIYGTRPWKVFGEGAEHKIEAFHEPKDSVFTAEDIRFTKKGSRLYAIVLDWPGEQLIVKSLASGSKLEARPVASVQLLGSKEALKWAQDPDGLKIQLPQAKPCDYAYAFRIGFKQQPTVGKPTSGATQ